LIPQSKRATIAREERAMTPLSIEVRDLRFDTGAGIPRHWHGGRKSVTHFFDNLSILFPPGERFFIHAVRAHEDKVTDPALAEQVRAFCGQEGVHTREHVAYNRMLATQGYPVERLEARVQRLLDQVKRRAPPRAHLAATCALEHFTSLMAELVLRDPRTLEGAHPTMTALWRWHAAEESEHRAVAFDVYQAAGGTWFRRCLVMWVSTLVFWARVFEQQLELMWTDRTLFNPAEWWRLFKFLWVNPGSMRRIVVPYFSYYLPGFHPWQHDNRELLEKWKSEQLPALARPGS
jgi:uncharacterized protein